MHPRSRIRPPTTDRKEPAMPEAPRTRTIVITGAGSGIGRASALRLGVPGCHILALDRDRDSAAQTARAVEAAGGQCRAVTCDVTDQAGTEKALASLTAVNVLINSAG